MIGCFYTKGTLIQLNRKPFVILKPTEGFFDNYLDPTSLTTPSYYCVHTSQFYLGDEAPNKFLVHQNFICNLTQRYAYLLYLLFNTKVVLKIFKTASGCTPLLVSDQMSGGKEELVSLKFLVYGIFYRTLSDKNLYLSSYESFLRFGNIDYLPYRLSTSVVVPQTWYTYSRKSFTYSLKFPINPDNFSGRSSISMEQLFMVLSYFGAIPYMGSAYYEFDTKSLPDLLDSIDSYLSSTDSNKSILGVPSSLLEPKVDRVFGGDTPKLLIVIAAAQLTSSFM